MLPQLYSIKTFGLLNFVEVVVATRLFILHWQGLYC